MNMKRLIFLPLLLVPGLGLAESLEPEYPQTRRLVERVKRAAELFEKEGHAACDAFKTAGSEWLAGDTYVFVLDFAGRGRCHPARPALEGQSLFELHDADGKPIMDLMLRQLQDGAEEGWVHYLWPRPGASVQTWKSTYLRRAHCPDDDVDYIMASGAYNLPPERLFVVDRVDEATRLLASEGRDAFATLRSRAGGFIFHEAYVFVMSFEGVMLVHPSTPGLEGTNVLNIRDPDGMRLGREMLRVLEDAETGWVEYFWPRPGEREPKFKETYVRKVEVDGEFLVVGAGVYLD